MRILIVDDEKRFAKVLCQALNADGYKDVDMASSGQEALDAVRVKPCDVLVTDLRMPGMSGLELMGEVGRRSPGTEIILMTAFADVATAREALKRGAVDYLVKPFDNQELSALLKQIQARRTAAGEKPADSEDSNLFMGMAGQSPVMRKMFEAVERVARSDASILILGESGTGKELIARAVHDLSPRHRGPFVDLHCAAIPENLLESELFGHERGAFTGAHDRKRGRLELAAGGTVFLDEIGEMPLPLQPKLLRFLQEHQFIRVGGSETITVDVRIVAATNRNLEEEVKAGNFREDLFYRLDVVDIIIPPLRERMSDIEPLVYYFLRLKGLVADAFSPEAMETLKGYSWPGNVRELQNAVERAVIDAVGGRIEPRHLPEKLLGETVAATEAAGNEISEQDMDLVSNEKQIIEQALRRTGGNKTAAAKLLGITRRRLYSRMKLLGID
jgi:DNA-binding NtrC family response regulator